MKHWYMFMTNGGEYVAADSQLSGRLQVVGEPMFEGRKVPEVVVWGVFKQFGGFVFGLDGWRCIEGMRRRYPNEPAQTM